MRVTVDILHGIKLETVLLKFGSQDETGGADGSLKDIDMKYGCNIMVHGLCYCITLVTFK